MNSEFLSVQRVCASKTRECGFGLMPKASLAGAQEVFLLDGSGTVSACRKFGRQSQFRFRQSQCFSQQIRLANAAHMLSAVCAHQLPAT
jgi:hypothetical protein